MSIYQEFKTFIAKGNVVELAVAVVVGGAFGNIVKAFVDGLVMPLVTLALPTGIQWEQWVLFGKFRIGAVLGATFNFLVISFVVFLVLVKLIGSLMKRKEEPVATPATKMCPECLETIPAAATRCRHCTSKLS